MLGYIVRRMFHSIITLVVVLTFAFFMLYLTGDPAATLLPTWATQAQIDELNHRMGFDQPLVVQYMRYVSNVARGNLGRSFRHHVPVSQLLLERLPATVLLAISAISFSVVIGAPLGVIAAVKRTTVLEMLTMGTAILGQSIPPFWLGIMLMLVFSVNLGLLPTSGFRDLSSLIMPTITLGAYFMVITARLIRSGLIDELRKDYVRTAYAKGTRATVVVLKHALRNALLPVVTILALQSALLIGGAIVTETVFAWPGIGRLMINAIYERDFPILRGGILLICSGLVIVNLATDLLYLVIDPRIHYD